MEYAVGVGLAMPVIKEAIDWIKYDVLEAERPEIRAQRETVALSGNVQTQIMEKQANIESRLMEKQRETRQKELEYLSGHISNIAQAEGEAFKFKANSIGTVFSDLRSKFGDQHARLMLNTLSYGSGDGNYRTASDILPASTYQYSSVAPPVVSIPPINYRNYGSADSLGQSNLINYLANQQERKDRLAREARAEKDIKETLEETKQKMGKEISKLEKQTEFLKQPLDVKAELYKNEIRKQKIQPIELLSALDSNLDDYQKKGIIKSLVTKSKDDNKEVVEAFYNSYKKIPGKIETLKDRKLYLSEVYDNEDIPNKLRSAMTNTFKETLIPFGFTSEDNSNLQKRGNLKATIQEKVTQSEQNAKNALEKLKGNPEMDAYYKKHVDEAILYNLMSDKKKSNSINPLSAENVKRAMNDPKFRANPYSGFQVRGAEGKKEQ